MLREDLLPVYQEEFAKAMTVEYISNSIEAGDVDKVLEFEKKVLKLKLVHLHKMLLRPYTSVDGK